ncbi:MAG: hypothetical protein DMD99_09470 [Candidatus Rokuibacteriota bacterium]|nr:MAG: hypothetical protein DMD99_09470 [Candidatus Rokubacteria bacterium]
MTRASLREYAAVQRVRYQQATRAEKHRDRCVSVRAVVSTNSASAWVLETSSRALTIPSARVNSTRAMVREVSQDSETSRLRLSDPRRKSQAESENDLQPDQPHGHLGEDGWRESS